MSLQIGKQAPEFHAKAYHNGKFVEVKLSDYRGKWIVLVFYPRDFTFVCPTELTGFGKNKTEFDKLNTVVIGGSTDSAYSHKAWISKELPDVTYPVIADTSQTISREYGILSDDGASERGTFIIDPQGILRYMVVSSSSVGRSVSETLRVLRALQTGELCPIEWTPGQKTLGKA